MNGQGLKNVWAALKGGMRGAILCLTLAGCAAFPKVDWPAGPVGATPALLPMAEIAVPTTPALDRRGAALAAEAAALKARAAAIGAN